MRMTQAPTIFAGEGRQKKRPLVLVVDDQPCILDMLSCVLFLKGYEPVCVANGLEALEWFAEAQQVGLSPAAILLDLHMPVMNGEKFLAHLRAQWGDSAPIPPVILLTVDKSNHDHLACEDVLAKPFHIDDLYHRLSQVIMKERIHLC